MLVAGANKRIAFTHISILWKYNMKGHYRFEEADKFIKSQNYKGIDNYRDYCTKP